MADVDSDLRVHLVTRLGELRALARRLAFDGDDEYTLVQRKDGTMQWAYDGKPLYLWKKDTKPGDMTGDGVGGVWHVALEE